MGHTLDIAPYTGWVYPNETIFTWSVLIAVYPYLTGLVAGAFTVSSLYQVFGFQRLKPVAHLALLTSLCFMIFVPTPLLLHLGHPERAMNATLTPHWSSAMAMFGYFASFYVVLLILETWFAYRPYIVEQARNRTGLLGKFYQALTLGSHDVSEHALRYDQKWILWLAIIGIPAAHGLHGYVGFMYGSLKSREWWSSDLMPVIFLFSAIISGVSLLVVLYVASCKLRKVEIDAACVKGLAYTIWGFIMLAIVLELLAFANIVYKGREGVEMIMEYVTGPLLIPYFLLQFGIGLFVPFLWLSYMIWRGTGGRAMIFGVTVSAVLVLFSVFMMRWNVVIGGQEISKTGKGLLWYQPSLWGKEGLIVAALLCIAPLVALLGLSRLFPPWVHGTVSSRVTKLVEQEAVKQHLLGTSQA
ncbi:MAG TPA: NrfD/PsrC family molybdoenzyme membrane anchor subunit [Casimicrobiaceae bacterium]|nr:NrfD/PsrC family molybdoenzyme membrane anchor subunit [Casimicrobiaceae bacterium]